MVVCAFGGRLGTGLWFSSSLWKWLGPLQMESLSFNFTKIMMTDVGLGAKNEDGQPATVGYDLGLGNVM